MQNWHNKLGTPIIYVDCKYEKGIIHSNACIQFSLLYFFTRGAYTHFSIIVCVEKILGKRKRADKKQKDGKTDRRTNSRQMSGKK